MSRLTIGLGLDSRGGNEEVVGIKNTGFLVLFLR
jgi:hypothetical protein